MTRNVPAAIWVSALLLFGSGAYGGPPSGEERIPPSDGKEMDPMEVLESLAGTWEGTCRTWFRPGELGDTSKIKGTFKPMLGGKLVRHTYESAMMGKPRTGEETIVFNAVEGNFEVSWFDSFHMNAGILFSEGKPTETGFSVVGRYRMRPDQDPWGWKTVFEIAGEDHLTITAYNITPGGREAKAVETVYERAQSS